MKSMGERANEKLLVKFVKLRGALDSGMDAGELSK